MNAAELEARTIAALERLSAAPPPPQAPAAPPPPGYRLTCPGCGRTDTVPTDPKDSVFTCDDCGTRVSYGVGMPTLINQPHPKDRRFLETIIRTAKGEIKLAFDREYAAAFALDILSVTDVDAWKRATAK